MPDFLSNIMKKRIYTAWEVLYEASRHKEYLPRVFCRDLLIENLKVSNITVFSYINALLGGMEYGDYKYFLLKKENNPKLFSVHFCRIKERVNSV